MICRFINEYAFLSNFWMQDFILAPGNLKYQSVEHYYQSQKTSNMIESKKILSATTPGKAKRLGQKVKIVENWEMIKYPIMFFGVYNKFCACPELKAKLIATGNEELIEGNNWNDCYWGVDLRTGKGENNLGKILMQVRKNV